MSRVTRFPIKWVNTVITLHIIPLVVIKCVVIIIEQIANAHKELPCRLSRQSQLESSDQSVTCDDANALFEG